MGSLNDVILVDDVNDVLAAGISGTLGINELLGSILIAKFSNATTMSGTVTLTDADYLLQRLNCNGANRIVKLSAYATTNHPFFIINSTGAAYTLDIQSDAGVTLLINPLADGEAALVIPDGVAGYKLVNPKGLTSITQVPNGYPCNGRLTLTSGMPIPTSDVTAAGTIYFTPYQGNSLALYDGVSSWTVFSFAEISLALTLTSGNVYDVFVYNNSGTPALELLAWTNTTTRATALTTQNGILVKSGATTRRYLGTICASGTNKTEDSTSKRYLYNYYNRIRREAHCSEPTNSWTYVTVSFRESNGGSTLGVSRVGIVIGWPEDAIEAIAKSLASASSGNVSFSTGIGINSTTVNSALLHGAFIVNPTTVVMSDTAFYEGILSVGLNTISWLELGAANMTFYGDDNIPTTMQAGMMVKVLM